MQGWRNQKGPGETVPRPSEISSLGRDLGGSGILKKGALLTDNVLFFRQFAIFYIHFVDVTRDTEHKRDLKYHRIKYYRVTNSMVLHAEEPLSKWERAEAAKKGMTRTHRKILESVPIDRESVPSTNHRGTVFIL